jgi:hypothetical protein
VQRLGGGGEGAARRWAWCPDVVSGEGETARRAAILGRRAPHGGSVVWECAVRAGGGDGIWKLGFFVWAS